MRQFTSILVLAFVLLASCSTTKDRWINRKYHHITGHYNAYFNGYESYADAVNQFEQGEKLNFEELMPFYYWPDEQQSKSMFTAMDRAIEKSAKVIKNHSMVFKGKQKNDYVIKSYLLTAKARFYKYELISALEVTGYMIDQFSSLEIAKDEILEARLLTALTQSRLGNTFAALEQLDEVYSKSLPKEQRLELEKAYAHAYVANKQWDEALEWCTKAVDGATKKADKVRLTYIQAQLLSKTGNRAESALAYQRVVDLHPNNYDIAFSAMMQRAANFDVYAEDIRVIEKELKKMLKDDKNIEYRDQIYYIWANKKLDLEMYPEAEDLLRSSISASVNNPKQKGKSYLALANIEFSFKAYVEAQGFYDSALAVLPPDYPGLDTLSERKQTLTDLVVQLDEISLQDSLQMLYGMSNEQLTQKFEEFIQNEKTRKEEAARQAELAAIRATENAVLNNAGPSAVSGGKWFFYNPAVRAQGMTAFQKTWGDRKLEDHWRTKQKPIDGFGTDIQEQITAQEEEIPMDSTALPTDENSVDYYMARVLKSSEDLAESYVKEAIAATEAGFIYKDGLNDLPEAIKMWGRETGAAAPHAESHAKGLYGQFLAYGEAGQDKEKLATKTTLLDLYPNSPYAALVNGIPQGPEIPQAEQGAYDAAYADFEQLQIQAATAKVQAFEQRFPQSALMPKVALLKAYIVGASGEEEPTKEALKEVVKTYKGTVESTRAEQLLALLSDLKKQEEGGPQSSQGVGDQKVNKIKFQEAENAPYKFIISIPSDNSSIQDLRNSLADFNKEYFKFDNLRIQNIFYNPETQFIVVSGLRTRSKAKVYLDMFNQAGLHMMQYIPAQTSAIFLINNANFGQVYRDKLLKEYVTYFTELNQ